MPLIDFKCNKCGKEFFEILNGDEKAKCPQCGSEDIKRVYKGKFYGKNSCGGSCSHCSGCH